MLIFWLRFYVSFIVPFRGFDDQTLFSFRLVGAHPLSFSISAQASFIFAFFEGSDLSSAAASWGLHGIPSILADCPPSSISFVPVLFCFFLLIPLFLFAFNVTILLFIGHFNVFSLLSDPSVPIELTLSSMHSPAVSSWSFLVSPHSLLVSVFSWVRSSLAVTFPFVASLWPFGLSASPAVLNSLPFSLPFRLFFSRKLPLALSIWPCARLLSALPWFWSSFVFIHMRPYYLPSTAQLSYQPLLPFLDFVALAPADVTSFAR